MVTKKITLAAGKQEFGVCGLKKKTKNSMNTRNSWLLLQQEQGCGLQEDFCGFFVSDLPGARCQIARLPNQVGNPTRPECCNEKRRKAGRAEHLLRCSKKKGAHAI